MKTITDTITGINGTVAEITISIPDPALTRSVTDMRERGNSVQAVVESRTLAGTFYHVTLWKSSKRTLCNCAAGRRGRKCWHTDAVRQVWTLVAELARADYQDLVTEYGADVVRAEWERHMARHGAPVEATQDAARTLAQIHRKQAA